MDALVTKTCRRRLSETEESAKIFGVEIKFDIPRRLSATDANVNFPYTITTTASELASMNANVNTAKSDLSAFTTALKSALTAQGGDLQTVASSVTVTGVTGGIQVTETSAAALPARGVFHPSTMIASLTMLLLMV